MLDLVPSLQLSESAPGRLPGGQPIAVIDIGSNSVRVVVYEHLSRAPTQLFNEKVLCGLGRGVGTKGRMRAESVEMALNALRRFRAIVQNMGVTHIRAIATAAAREAQNGPDFIREAEAVCGTEIEVLSGKREAELAALGVVAGFHHPDGLVGDLGGGSLELTEVLRTRIGRGVSMPLGAIVLQERSEGALKKAEKIVRTCLDRSLPMRKEGHAAFYAVGGTWRSFARLHMRQRGYPLSVMHGYAIPTRDAIEFARLIQRVQPETLESIEMVASGRRPLLAYGALVMEQLLRRAKPKRVVISAGGVREGLLYELLDERSKRADPLLMAARELGFLRSRSPRHCEELVAWADQFFESSGLDEENEEKRLRRAACYLSDIGWRAHPDYRGEQSLNIIAHAGFVGIDHPGRAFLALAVFYRHVGNDDDELAPRLRELVSSRMIDRARILGALIRIAYLISAAMPGTLPRCPLVVRRNTCTLTLPRDLRDLAADRVLGRIRQMARLLGREAGIVIEDEGR